MANKVEITGDWWIVGEPDNVVSGSLSFLENEWIKLDLLGVFNSELENFPSLNINGKASSGKPISVLNCLRTKSEQTQGSGTSSFIGSFGLIGTHFPSLDEVVFDSFSFHPTQLENWLWEFPVTADITRKGVKATFKEPHRKVYPINDELEISIYYSLGPVSIGGTQTELKAEPRVIIKPQEQLAFKEFHDIANHLNRFFSLLLMAPVYIEHPIGHQYSEHAPTPTNSELYIPISRIETQKLHPVDMLVYYKKVSKRLRWILKKWFEKKEILGPVLDLYFANLYNIGYSQVQIFLNYAQALETYHARRYRSKVTIPKNIRSDLESIYSSFPKQTKTWLQDKLSNVHFLSFAKRLAYLIRINPLAVVSQYGSKEEFIKRLEILEIIMCITVRICV